MARPGRRSRPRFTILVMVLLSVTILTIDAKNVPVLSTVRSGMMEALAPVESGFRSVTTPIRNAWKGVSDYDDLDRENRRLRRQLDDLRSQQLTRDDLVAQVEKLREQLDVGFSAEIPKIYAQIATGNFSSFDDFTARIDKGSRAGIAVGMPVTTNAGLIGTVVRVSPDRSVVHLITDPEFNVGVRLKSNTLGIGRGTGPGNRWLVDRGVPLNAEVSVDDPVTTSGQARALFPPDIPIGRVTRITRSQAEQVQLLDVELAADLSRLDYVQVLRWRPSELQAR